MGLPPTPLPPIRLLPPARRASPLPAGAASLTIHGALLVLVFAGSGQWRSAQPASSMMRQTNVLAFTYLVLAPAGQRPEDGSHDGPPGLTAPVPRSTGAKHRLPAGTLSALEPADLTPTTVASLTLRVAPPQPVALPSIALTPAAGGPNGDAVRTRGQRFGPSLIELGGRGSVKVAELIGKMGEACPVLRLPQHAGTVAVAVTFVVDTFGAVDRATLRVVQRPGQPPEPTGFVPHLYTVGASVRVDRRLDAGAGYGPVVTEDVVGHVAALRFRPALRNGRPVRSSVLVACQTG